MVVGSSIVLCLAGVSHAANYEWDANGNAAGLGGTGAWNTTSALGAVAERRLLPVHASKAR